MNRETAARVPRVGHKVDATGKKPFDDLAGRWLGEGLANERGRAFLVAIKRFAKQRLLIAKSRVQAWPVDTHGLGESGQRSPFVAPFPEYRKRLIQGLVHVKSTGSSRRHSNPLDFVPIDTLRPLTGVVQSDIFTC